LCTDSTGQRYNRHAQTQRIGDLPGGKSLLRSVVSPGSV
jgi:hypothetical protein